MKRTISFAALLLTVFLAGCTSIEGPGQWRDMSSNFDNWNQIGDANWRIENGEFVADGGNGHLVTKENFSDMQIRLEFWVDEPANSGVFLRASDPESITQSNSYEVNIYDTRPDQTYRTGGVVEFSAPSVSIDTGGKWNTYNITARGGKIDVVLNGITTVRLEDETYADGPFSLQYAAGVVKFRNVQVRRL